MTLPRLLTTLALAALSLPAAARAQAPADDSTPPPAGREFRGLWVATVANIDWPSKPGLPVEKQKAEAVALLDRAAELNLNVIVLQVRTSCDALYPSELEPWSYYLTGQQGKPPEPMYDPLQFWVDETHARGMELHAWFNPFRAKPSGVKYDLADSHVAVERPDLVRTYGNGKTEYLWLDPSMPDARDRTLAVMLDVVNRYDVDGVHIDDYFYPYPVSTIPEKGEDADAEDARPKAIPFPDGAEFDLYRKAGGTLSRDDWRRSNIDDLVERMYREIKAAKPHVKVGISPFGIWRPGNPPSVVGFDQYAKLYADARLWLREGWCDYYSPQLYWPVYSTGQSFPALLHWWLGENDKGRTIAPGLYTSKRAATKEGGNNELVSEIMVARHTPGSEGHVHFSAKVLARDTNGVASRLRDDAYRGPALVPATPWVEDEPPAAPTDLALDEMVANAVVETPAGPASETLESAGPTTRPADAPATAPADAKKADAESIEDVEKLSTAVVALKKPTTRPAVTGQLKVAWSAPAGGVDDVARYALYARYGGPLAEAKLKADAAARGLKDPDSEPRPPAKPTDAALEAGTGDDEGDAAADVPVGTWRLVRVLPAGETSAVLDERGNYRTRAERGVSDVAKDGTPLKPEGPPRPNPAARITAVAVSAVDHCGNEGERVVVERP